MENYKNISRESSVLKYEIGDDFIIVQFSTPSKNNSTTYKYTYTSAGEDNVERMKELAVSGKGLKTFIEANARKLYESKY